MRKNYDENSIKQLIEKYNIDQLFDNMDLPFYTIQYEKESFYNNPMMQIIYFRLG
ncbi:hypothetical protein [Clostridium beijerinckii]|uniref:hypothetical protein n=1 Tax=Clostridium beijerinckii TaxID=1520 RepID=UPI00156F81E5|nr:hypothetical protein [Clostridium beijerinckii]NRX88720.1 hypothetical protein [Clostridium beijerinckii]